MLVLLVLLVVMQVLLLIDSKSLWVFFFIAALCSVDNLNLWEEQEDRLMAAVDVASKLPGLLFLCRGFFFSVAGSCKRSFYS